MHGATYHWLRLRSAPGDASSRSARPLGPPPTGVEIWGTFAGLFGIGTNELAIVLHGESIAPNDWLAESGYTVAESYEFAPTVRPVGFAPLERPGLYVFRFFDVANADTDEVARISNEAWTTFEHTDAYATEPMALFREVDRSRPSSFMLLVTWYDGFGSWEASRDPAPEARELFRRRRQLTRGAVAYATRLLAPA